MSDYCIPRGYIHHCTTRAVLFAKDMLFVRVFTGEKDAHVCDDHGSGGASQCKVNYMREYCFVQYYEINIGDDLFNDAVYKNLN